MPDSWKLRAVYEFATRMQRLQIVARNLVLATPFGLLGNDENALTFALGYTFRECPQLLHRFLRDIGIKGLHRKSLENARIDLQRHGASAGYLGITDLEVVIPEKLHVIIEAKVGFSLPTCEQCAQYLPRFMGSSAPIRKLVALTETADESFVDRFSAREPGLRNRLLAYRWTELIPHCVSLMRKVSRTSTSSQFLRWFYEFLDREYQMKAFTHEIWIVPISKEPLWPNGWSFLDTHLKRKVYFTTSYPQVRPLYIAFRVRGHVTALNRVMRIEHEVPLVDRVPELKNKVEWAGEPFSIWHLDDPVPLPKPIPTGGRLWQRHVWCDVDVLLQSKTVKEVEDRMRARRNV
jgi:hypothetical protein